MLQSGCKQLLQHILFRKSSFIFSKYRITQKNLLGRRISHRAHQTAIA
ncbi:Uncharacterised protein [Segatella copri]|nr:Uncharacterised protein [Segatella copri]